jgi:hypothetical protein
MSDFGTCKKCGATMNFPVHVCLGPNKKDAQIAALTARVVELSAFARGMLDLCPHTECEGVQELAVNQGVLVEVTVTEPCGDNCMCAEVSDFPLTCYRLAPDLKQPDADGVKHE